MRVRRDWLATLAVCVWLCGCACERPWIRPTYQTLPESPDQHPAPVTRAEAMRDPGWRHELDAQESRGPSFTIGPAPKGAP